MGPKKETKEETDEKNKSPTSKKSKKSNKSKSPPGKSDGESEDDEFQLKPLENNPIIDLLTVKIID